MGNPALALVGATGFIGRHLLEALAPRPVRVLVHGSWPTWLLAMTHVQAVPGDILRPESLDPLLEGTSVVMNLSGQVSSEPVEYLDVNVQGTLVLAQACLRHGADRFIHASSALVYGDALHASEEAPCRPLTPYATMKAAAEKILQTVFCARLRLSFLRLSNVYGPYQAKGLLPYLIGCLRERRPVTIDADGAQVRDFVHVRDVTDAFLKAGAAPDCEGTINIGSGTATSVMTLLRLLEDVLEVPAKGQYRPEHSGGERQNTVNISKATEVLGWQPTVGLVDGLRSCVESDILCVRQGVEA